LEFSYFDGDQSKTRFEGHECTKDASSYSNPPVPGNVGFRRRQTKPGTETRLSVFPYDLGNLSASQYKAGFIAILHDRYVPDMPKVNSRGEAICAGWMATACVLSSFEDSDMLCNSLLAMALPFAGRERQDPEICATSLRHYSKAINGLRTGLKFGTLALDENQLDMSLVTCLACAMYEASTDLFVAESLADLLQITSNRSFAAFLNHLRGVGALLRERGVENLRSSPSRRVFWVGFISLTNCYFFL